MNFIESHVSRGESAATILLSMLISGVEFYPAADQAHQAVLLREVGPEQHF